MVSPQMLFSFSAQDEIVLLLLLVGLAALLIAAPALRIPYPILLVLGGLAIGFLPGVPEVELEPDVVFLLFLPPILFGAGYFTSIRDFKANLRAILLLSVGLVLFTMTAVAIVVHWLLPELGWPIAFATGAIIAPPDAVAATSVFNRLGAPRRLVTILEGESLVNDATALVALKTALTAASTGFSLVDASTSFVIVAVGGVLFGLVVGTLAWRVIARIDDTILAIVLTLLIPLGIYAPAEEFLHVSGVLAVVTAGLIAGRGASHALTSAQRVLGEAAWGTVVFLINGAVFVLIGLQLPIVLRDVG